MKDCEIDFIYNIFKYLLSNQDIKGIDFLLNNIHCQLCSIDFILTLLTVTFPVRSKLINRQKIYNIALQRFGFEIVKGLE